MKWHLRGIVSLAAMLALLAGLGGTAAAQGTTQQGGTGQTGQTGQVGTVTKTFSLTVNGTVPQDAAFAVFYATRDETRANPDNPHIYLFCGAVPADAGVPSKPACQAKTYSMTVDYPAGTEIAFAFLRTDASGNTFDFFFASFAGQQPSAADAGDFEVLNTDRTNSAWYTFGATNQQSGTGQTGAGNAQTGGNTQQGGNGQTGSGASGGNNQQGGTGQTGQVPTQMPATGAGGAAGLPIGSAAAAAAMAVSALAALRRSR